MDLTWRVQFIDVAVGVFFDTKARKEGICQYLQPLAISEIVE